MELGMYSVELSRPCVEELFHAIRGYGFTQVQFDFLSVCEEEMPAAMDAGLLSRIRRAADENGVKIVSVNGTFNMIHPDPDARADGLRRFETLAQSVSALGCNLVTLCTGSRNPQNMWAWDEGNRAQSAWDDLLITTQSALKLAEKYDLVLGLEAEPNNCMNTMERCRQIIDVFESPRLKVIMDVANLFQPGQARAENVRPTMRRAFDLLGPDVALAHGKDILAGEGLHCTYAGNGIVDFPYFKELLEEAGYSGCMLLHGLKHEDEFPKCVKFIREALGG